MKNQFREDTRPQRISRASVAVITRRNNDHIEWLLQWNEKWQAMNVIAGHKETTDTNDLTCLVREIHEELFEVLPEEKLECMQTALSGNNDTYKRTHSAWQDAYIERIMRIGRMPFEYNDFSISVKCLTHYVFHVYKVLLYLQTSSVQTESLGIPASHGMNEWVSIEEMRRGVTSEERPISKTVPRILTWIQTQERR